MGMLLSCPFTAIFFTLSTEPHQPHNIKHPVAPQAPEESPAGHKHEKYIAEVGNENPHHTTESETREEYNPDLWPAANYDVHVFYYAWYGSKIHDTKWLHWNHRFVG